MRDSRVLHALRVHGAAYTLTLTRKQMVVVVDGWRRVLCGPLRSFWLVLHLIVWLGRQSFFQQYRPQRSPRTGRCPTTLYSAATPQVI